MKVLVLVKKITAVAIAVVLLFCGFSVGYYFGSTERGGMVILKPDQASGFPLDKAADITKIVNLNTAAVSELTALPGIGEGKLEKLAPYLIVE